MNGKTATAIGLLFIIIGIRAGIPTGWAAGIPAHREAYPVESGVHTNSGPTTIVAFSGIVRLPQAPWLRLHFSEYELGQRSFVQMTSDKDGGRQRHNAITLFQWGNSSAYFNGDAFLIELHVAPGEVGIFFRIDEITVGEPMELLLPESLCGTDNRVPSTDARIGRLTFVTPLGTPDTACTVWLVSNGGLLTAGHCVDFDPDGSGSALPDGVLDIDNNDVVEVSVPDSLNNGTLVFANPNDQYAIQINSVVWNFDGEGQGYGKDWALFRVFANPNTGLMPHVAQGDFFRMTNANPDSDATIRITGYGTDDSPNMSRNQIQQSSTGKYTGEDSDGDDIWHRYQVDTTGGNSGSPVIWEGNQYAIGIHTNGGCQGDGSGSNAGTSFEHNPLENALENFPGSNAVFLDRIRYGTTENGTIFHPYDSIAEGVNSAPAGGILSIVKGFYSEVITINKKMTITAPAGTVMIGYQP